MIRLAACVWIAFPLIAQSPFDTAQTALEAIRAANPIVIPVTTLPPSDVPIPVPVDEYRRAIDNINRQLGVFVAPAPQPVVRTEAGVTTIVFPAAFQDSATDTLVLPIRYLTVITGDWKLRRPISPPSGTRRLWIKGR